jgi:hypothetical protein
MVAVLATALAGCAKKLTVLKLASHGSQASWDVSATACALPRLHTLVLKTSSKIMVTSSLAALTTLSRLELHGGGGVSFELNADLPPSLTSLALELYDFDGPLPAQVNISSKFATSA